MFSVELKWKTGLYLSMGVLKAKLTLLRRSLIYLPVTPPRYPGGNTLLCWDSGTLSRNGSRMWVLLFYITPSVLGTPAVWGRGWSAFTALIRQKCAFRLTKVRQGFRLFPPAQQSPSPLKGGEQIKTKSWCYCRMSLSLASTEIRKHNLTTPTPSDTGSPAHSSLKDTSRFVILIQGSSSVLKLTLIGVMLAPLITECLSKLAILSYWPHL